MRDKDKNVFKKANVQLIYKIIVITYMYESVYTEVFHE